jgi:hypothetical protein
MALELIYVAQLLIVAAATSTAGFYYGRNRLHSDYEEVLSLTEQDLDELHGKYQQILLEKNQAEEGISVAQQVAIRSVEHAFEAGRKSVLESKSKTSK